MFEGVTRVGSHGADEVELLVQEEAPQSGREDLRADDLRPVEPLQGHTPPDFQPAEVGEGARAAWRAGSKVR